MGWYSKRHQEHPSERLTRVADFTFKMVGTRAEPNLKTKGAETYGIMKFLLFLISKYTSRIGEEWQRLLRAGEALDSMIDIWLKHKDSWTIPAADRKEHMRYALQAR